MAWELAKYNENGAMDMIVAILDCDHVIHVKIHKIRWIWGVGLDIHVFTTKNMGRQWLWEIINNNDVDMYGPMYNDKRANGTRRYHITIVVKQFNHGEWVWDDPNWG